MRNVLVICSLLSIVAHGQSPCDQVSFVSRDGWGARPPTSITNLTSKPFSFYVIHHTYQPPKLVFLRIKLFSQLDSFQLL